MGPVDYKIYLLYHSPDSQSLAADSIILHQSHNTPPGTHWCWVDGAVWNT